jgi:hypothetical protein
MQVETAAIDGTYGELVDAAEDIADILSAKANNRLDLTPALERWLVDQLEAIEVGLIRHVPAERGDPEIDGAYVASAAVATGRHSA